jgi:hypothetical protein
MQKFLYPVLLTLALSSGQAFADNDPQVLPAKAECSLDGQTTGLTEDCSALRVTFQTGVTDCLQAKQAKADASAGAIYTHNAQSDRARMLICKGEVRERMGLAD